MDAGAVAVALAAAVAVATVVPLGDVLWTLGLTLLAVGLGYGVTDASGADGAADVLLVVLAGLGGMAFARAFPEPEVASGAALLGLALSALQLGSGDGVATDVDPAVLGWLAAFLTWARRVEGLRAVTTTALLVPLPAVAVAVGTADDRAVPVVAVMAGVFLAANGDRIVAALRR